MFLKMLLLYVKKAILTYIYIISGPRLEQLQVLTALYTFCFLLSDNKRFPGSV
jgi:hypothetical protein